jgi:hypothetical protein
MADKKRSESLQEQLDRLLAQSPKPYTADEIKQIEKGRKGQKDIDAGRATVEQRNQEVRKAQEQIDKLNEQIGKAIEFEAGEGSKARGNAKADEREAEKRSPWGIAAQVGSGLPAGAAGYMAGRYAGGFANADADEAQRSRNQALEKVAQDRRAGLTTREGARTATELAGARPPQSRLGRFMGRAGAQSTLGALMAGKGLLLSQAVSEEDPLLNQAVNQGFSSAMIGGGVGLAEKGLQHGFNPKVAPDASSLAVIESNQLRRGGLNAAQPNVVDRGDLTALPAPDDSGPTPGGRTHLAEQAKALGVKVTTRMNKQEIADAMAAKLKEVGGKRVRAPKLPKGTGAAGVAGGLAYAMTPDSAEAYDPSTGAPTGGSNQKQAVTNAALAGGAAYGVSKGLSALGPVAKGVMAGASEGMAPAAIDSLTDWHSQPEELQKFDQFATGNLPDFMTGGSRERLSMAQVPPRNPMRPTAGMFEPQGADAEFEAALQAFLQEYEADNGSAGDSMAAEAY